MAVAELEDEKPPSRLSSVAREDREESRREPLREVTDCRELKVEDGLGPAGAPASSLAALRSPLYRCRTPPSLGGATAGAVTETC